MMDILLRPNEEYVVAYIDDLLIHSEAETGTVVFPGVTRT